MENEWNRLTKINTKTMERKRLGESDHISVPKVLIITLFLSWGNMRESVFFESKKPTKSCWWRSLHNKLGSKLLCGH